MNDNERNAANALRWRWNEKRPIRPFVFRVVGEIPVKPGNLVSHGTIYEVLETLWDMALCVPTGVKDIPGFYSLSWPDGELIIEDEVWFYAESIEDTKVPERMT